MKTDATTYTEYHYDYDQQLVQVKKYVSSSLSQTITYTYDPMGNLVKKYDGGTTTTYVQDLNGGLPQILIEDDGATVAKYTYGADRLKVSRSGEYYYFYDGLGSTRTITNTSGTVICRYVYDVYGKVLDSETNEQQTWNNFKFTGELYDEDTDLLYLRARWYDPTTGRFLTRDSYLMAKFDEPSSFNLYGYCQNDPVNCMDPSGHSLMSSLTTSTGVISTLLNLAQINIPLFSRVNPLSKARIQMSDITNKIGDKWQATKELLSSIWNNYNYDCYTCMPEYECLEVIIESLKVSEQIFCPDFFMFSVNIALPECPLFGGSGSVVLDRHGQYYINGIELRYKNQDMIHLVPGGNVGKSFLGWSFTLAMGWLLTDTTYKRNVDYCQQFFSGLYMDASLGFAAGFGAIYSIDASGTAFYTGAMLPQVGISVGTSVYLGRNKRYAWNREYLWREPYEYGDHFGIIL